MVTIDIIIILLQYSLATIPWFFRYGITRFNEYFRRKDEFLALSYEN